MTSAQPPTNPGTHRAATESIANGALSLPVPMRYASEFWIDAAQRTVLFLDVLRQRSERYAEHAAKVAPHVLKFGCDLIMDGRTLPRPVNYVLVRIDPPEGTTIDKKKRPFVVVDPRAGHGPGIGGFKPQSEIGVAFNAGHPCYFIGFLPEPVAGQTIGDVATAQAAFLERVIALHPEAEGKPAVIGNCQAGWAVMILAAIRPDLFGPIIVAGSPLSYWAGTRGQNPMRYTGGLLGGSWMTALLGDLGNGKFDGAWLVSNFENLNPANTLWSKQHNLYANIDTEGPRYLEFEQWWGGHVLLNAEEMQQIVDQLFVGNTLSSARMTTTDHKRIDLRTIRSPIIVFCSKGDNITPPAQALGWIRDLYQDVDQIRIHGQTIVYAVHDKIGHLGIFVSGSVAKKEHEEFASNIDLIDVLPPGLYEAVITPRQGGESGADLIGGDFLVRFERRTLDDIRALCGDEAGEVRKFTAVQRISDTNLGLYRSFVQPWVRLYTSDATAGLLRRLHPVRFQYEVFGSSNPLAAPLAALAENVRQHRQPVGADNPFWQVQEQTSAWIEQSLDAYRDMRDLTLEAVFNVTYGSPLMQALTGLRASDEPPRRHPGDDVMYHSLVEQRKAEIKTRISQGGPREAIIRALFYIRGPERAIDERGFRYLKKMRDEAAGGLSLAAFKRIAREQYFMLFLDEEAAVAALPAMIEKDPKLASKLAGKLDELLSVVGLTTEKAKERKAEIEGMLADVLSEREKAATRQQSRPSVPEGARSEAVRSAKR